MTDDIYERMQAAIDNVHDMDVTLDDYARACAAVARGMLAENARLHAAQFATALDEIERLRGLIQWAHDTLYEINPSNYDHDDVCRINDASVEVILGLAPTIGETHGKSQEWWGARAALKGTDQ